MQEPQLEQNRQDTTNTLETAGNVQTKPEKSGIPEQPIQLPEAPHHTGAGRPTIYNPALAGAILHDIATDAARPIEQIARDHGIPKQTIYYWVGIIPKFSDAFTRALATRAIAEVQARADEQEKLWDKIGESTDLLALKQTDSYIRLAHVRQGATQWRAAAHNRDVYGDKQTITLEGDPARVRVDAWQARATEATVVDPPK